MATQAGDLGDVVVGITRDLGRLKYTDMSSAIRKHHALKKLMKRGHMKVFDSGYEFQWNVMTGHNSSARMTGLFPTANPNYKDVLITGSAPFRHSMFDWGIDRRMIQMNSAGINRVVDIVEVQRKAAMISWIEMLEPLIWRNPSTSSDDPHGVYHWIVKNATTGFNGGAPSGYTTVGNISPTTYTRWKNYTAQYTDPTEEDLVAKVDVALTSVDFTPPVDMPTYSTADGQELYTVREIRDEMKNLAKAQNDQLGFDMDPVAGKLMFRRLPINEVPILENDTDDPFIGIDWSEMRLAVLKNEWMKDTVFESMPNQPTTSANYTTSTFNLYTTSRRAHFIVAKGTSGAV